MKRIRCEYEKKGLTSEQTIIDMIALAQETEMEYYKIIDGVIVLVDSSSNTEKTIKRFLLERKMETLSHGEDFCFTPGKQRFANLVSCAHEFDFPSRVGRFMQVSKKKSENVGLTWREIIIETFTCTIKQASLTEEEFDILVKDLYTYWYYREKIEDSLIYNFYQLCTKSKQDRKKKKK